VSFTSCFEKPVINFEVESLLLGMVTQAVMPGPQARRAMIRQVIGCTN